MEEEGIGSRGIVFDTKGSCLLCWKRGGLSTEEDGEDPSNSSTSGTPFFRSMFSKVVQLDFQKALEAHLISSLLTTAGGTQEEAGLNAQVPLCAGCSAQVGNFSTLVKELGLCVRNILGLLNSGDEDADERRKEEGVYYGGAVVDKLRAEVKSKCADWANNAILVPMGPQQVNVNETPAAVRVTVTSTSNTPTTPPSTCQSGNQSTVRKCNNWESCKEAFSSSADGLQNHAMQDSSHDHRHAFCSQFKYPLVDQTLFNQMVNQVFLELVDHPTNTGGGLFTCSLCPDQLFNSQKGDLDSHIIDCHMDELGSRLMILQEEERSRTEEEVLAGPSSSEHPGPSESSVVIQFTALSLAKMQCQLCSKIIPAGDIPTHIASHQGRRNPHQQCPHCQVPFLDAGNLRRHTLRSHRHAFLSHFRDPRLPPQQFAQMVEDIFDGFQFNQDPAQEGFYQCYFGCGEAGYYNRKVDLFGHLIHVHMEEIGSRLVALQESALERGLLPRANEVIPPTLGNTHHQAPGGDEIPPQLLSCPHCEELFFSQRSSELLDAHMVIHSRRDILCDLCPSPFQDFYHLRNHTASQHPDFLLLEYKDARLSQLEFLNCINAVVRRRLRIGDAHAAAGGYGVTCDFCLNQFRTEEDATAHLMYNHLGDIGGELVMAAQQTDDLPTE